MSISGLFRRVSRSQVNVRRPSAIINREVLTFDKALLSKFIENRCYLGCIAWKGKQHTDSVGSACVLCHCGDSAADNRAPYQGDELAPPHSITSSAAAPPMSAMKCRRCMDRPLPAKSIIGG
jgi:hypothetical protein